MEKNLAYLIPIFLLLGATVHAVQERSIPQFRYGYSYYENTKQLLKLHYEEKSFDEASEICHEEDASLAFWKTEEEMSNFKSMAKHILVWVGAYWEDGYLYEESGKLIDEYKNNYPQNSYDRNSMKRICMENKVTVIRDCPETMSFICVKLFDINIVHHVRNGSTPFFRNDYTYIDVNSYFIKTHNPQTWKDAMKICEEEDAEIITVDRSDNVTILTDMLMPGEQLWVGASDLLVETHYETIHGDPLNNNGINATNGHCVTLNYMGNFDSNSCQDNVKFVCQKRLKTYYYECDTADEGYQKFFESEKCQKYHYILKNWHDALKTCKIENATLFVINDNLEANRLSDKLKEINKFDNHDDHSDYSIFHVGFHDLFIEGMYRTVNGLFLKDTGYAVWSKHYPKPYMGLNCGGLTVEGTLQNGGCDVRAMFVCQKTAQKFNLQSPAPKPIVLSGMMNDF